MVNRSNVFKVLGGIIIALVLMLIAINILFLKTVCSTRQCTLINVFTILLLIWATAFWLAVLKYSKKEKKK